jgi:integrase
LGNDPSFSRSDRRFSSFEPLLRSLDCAILAFLMLCNVSPPTGFKSAFSSRQSVVANLQGIAAASSGSLNQAARTVPRVQQARLARSQIHRTASHQTSSQVFRYAIAHGLATRNPAADIKHSDVLGSRQKKNLARIEGKELPQLLRHIDAYHGAAVTRLAMKLMALTFVRTSELIGARWAEFDLKAERWDIPAERMKMKTPNIIPLSSQAVNILKTLHLISGRGALVFPGERDHEKPMSNNTILGALARMGYKGRMTGHGFRGIASTLLHEMRVIGYRVDVYEEVEAGRITADKAERLIAEQQAAWEAEGQAKERAAEEARRRAQQAAYERQQAAQAQDEAQRRAMALQLLQSGAFRPQQPYQLQPYQMPKATRCTSEWIGNQMQTICR